MFIIVAHKLRTKSLILKSPSTLLTFCPEPKTLQITKKWYCKYYFSKKQIIIEIITTLNSSILRSWLATIFNCATSDNATTETAFMFRLRLHSKRPVSALYLPLMSLILFWPYRQWQMVARELSHVLCKTISFHKKIYKFFGQPKKLNRGRERGPNWLYRVPCYRF